MSIYDLEKITISKDIIYSERFGNIPLRDELKVGVPINILVPKGKKLESEVKQHRDMRFQQANAYTEQFLRPSRTRHGPNAYQIQYYRLTENSDIA